MAPSIESSKVGIPQLATSFRPSSLSLAFLTSMNPCRWVGMRGNPHHFTAKHRKMTGGNGGGCHTGRRSRYCRKVALGGDKAKLVFN